LGMAACGALDLAGQVMEWLATPDGSPEQGEPLADAGPSEGVLLTYDDWSDGLEHLRCGSRGWFLPGYGYGNRGFRLFLPSNLRSGFWILNSES